MRSISSWFLSLVVFGFLQSLAFAQEPPRLELVLQTGKPPGNWGIGEGALSGDGKFAVTVDRSAAILWDCATGKKIRTFQGHTDSILSMAISPDGKHLVTGSSDMTAILWDVASGKKLQTFRESTPTDPDRPPGQQPRAGSVHGVALSSDGKRVATGSWQTASVWDAASGERLRTFKGFDTWVWGLALSGDGKSVLTARQGGGPAFLWDATTGKKLQTFDNVFGRLALSADGKHFVGRELEGKAALRETQTGKVVHTFAAPNYSIWSVALSANGKVALTGGILWDAQTGKAVRTFRGHAGSVVSVALSADGARALTVSGDDNTAFLWDTVSGKKLHTFREHPDNVSDVALSGDGKSLAVAGTGVNLWNLADGKKTGTLRGKRPYFQTVALSDNGKHVIAGSRDEEAILWEAESGKQLRTFPGYDGYYGPRVCVAISADAQRVVVLGLGTADLWDAARGDKLGTILHPDIPVKPGQRLEPSVLRALAGTGNLLFYNAALSGDGKRLLLVGKGPSLWDPASGKELQTFRGHTKGVRSVTLSGDGKLVLTGSEDKTAILWDVASGKKLRTFAGHNWDVTAVALSANGKLVATGSQTKVTLWDAASGDKLRDLEGHTGEIRDMVLSTDGKRLWTTSRDQSVRLWDTATGKERCRIYSLKMSDDWLAVTPDGYFDGSKAAWRFVAYREPDTLKLVDDDATLERFHRPGLLAQVWKVEE